MTEIRVLLVDDEYLALNLLAEFVGRMSGFVVVAKAKSALQAMEVLQKEKIDVMFLDIQMPMMSGNNFLKSLKNPPLTIFTTAYSEYAVEAFELDALDYLVKPFSFERFFQAINKVHHHFQKTQPQIGMSNVPISISENPEKQHLVLKADGKMYKIPFEEILFIEGLKEYVKVMCVNTHYITYERIKNLEEALPINRFIRVHKSYIVAKDKVKSIETNLLEIGKHFIPVSRDKKEEIMKEIFGL